MKIIARTNERSYLNNGKGEDWQVVTECQVRYPSGWRKCVRFPNGFKVKVERCEIRYIEED